MADTAALYFDTVINPQKGQVKLLASFIFQLPYQKAVDKALYRALNKALSNNKIALIVMKMPY